MGLYKRGNAYWFNVCFEGKRIQESLKTDNRKVAENRYAKVLTDLVEGRYFETNFAKKVLFQQMTERYLEEYEHSRDRTSLKALSKFFAPHRYAEGRAARLGVERYRLCERTHPR